jgi:hypothetical protein
MLKFLGERMNMPKAGNIVTNEFQPQFRANMAQDSTTFTQVSTSFEGVMMGDGVFCDYDNDGDLDVIVCGWNDTAFATKIYCNDNGVFTDIHADIAPIGGEKGIAWGDFDNDGDYDLAITGRLDSLGTQPVTKIYRNDNGVFVDINAPLMQLNGGSLTWVDFDNDGQLDLFVTGSPDNGFTFYSKLYRNDHGEFTEIPTNINGIWASSFQWGDYNNDGLPDLLLMGWGGSGAIATIYRNDGMQITIDSVGKSDTTQLFLDIQPSFEPAVLGNANWVDFDDDGLLDVSIMGMGYGHVPVTKIYRNVGDTSFVDIHADIYPLEIGGMAWGDYDNDGYLDFAITGCRDWFGDSTEARIYHNNQDGTFSDIGAVLSGGWDGSIAWGDFDNDGRLDLLVTGGTLPNPNQTNGGPYNPISALYKNNVTLANTRPTSPLGLAAQSNIQQVRFQWNTASDDQTPVTALTYNVRVGTSPGAMDVIAPNSVPSSGFRRVPRPGNAGYCRTYSLKNLPSGKYYWSVQTVDNELAGSSFADEQSFTIGGNNAGWQLISVPHNHPDAHTSVLYPTALSNSYTYVKGTGYQSTDVLENGKGYWLKFDPVNPDPVVSGASVTTVTVAVQEGWNLIGSLSTPILAASITSDTQGMVASEFYGYNYSYHASDTIQPGKGYWVKVNHAGSLTLSSASIAAGQTAIRIVATSDQPPSPPGIESVVPDLPKETKLEQNYPNPFNPSTIIQFSLPKATHVTLKVFNLLGQEVATLVSGEVAAGWHVQELNAANLSSGMYFYRLQAGTYSETKRLVVLK